MYGRNAIGGALNITTKQPSNEFDHFVSAEVGEDSYTKLQAGSSGPISQDKVLYRIAASYRDDHGLIDNVTLGREVDFAEKLSVRGRLLFYPTEQLTIGLRGFYADYDGGASYYAPTFPDFGESEGSRSPVEANTPGVGEREFTDFSIEIDYETSFATLTSITAVSKITEFFFQDIDFLAMPIVNLDLDLDLTAWSEEFRLTSNTEYRFSWQLGLYYLATDRDVRTRVFLDFDPFLGPVISDLPEFNDNIAYAVFGQISYDLSEKFNVAFAVRNDWDDREQFSPITLTTVNEKFEKFQPKVALTYFLSEDTMVYFSGGRGFRSGGFNVPSPLFPLMFREEIVDTYDLGFKGAWMDRRIQINGALFHSEDDNTQIFQFDAGSGTQGILNLNKSEFDGFELEVAYRPNSAFVLAAGVGLIESEITDFNGTKQFRGNQVPLVNQETYNLSAQYAFQLTHGLTLTPRLDFSSYGDLAWAIDNADQRTSNVNLLNLRLALVSDRWSVTAYAENLSDEDYDAEFNPAEFVGTPTDIYFPGRPRRIGISARLRF